MTSIRGGLPILLHLPPPIGGSLPSDGLPQPPSPHFARWIFALIFTNSFVLNCSSMSKSRLREEVKGQGPAGQGQRSGAIRSASPKELLLAVQGQVHQHQPVALRTVEGGRKGG